MCHKDRIVPQGLDYEVQGLVICPGDHGCDPGPYRCPRDD